MIESTRRAGRPRIILVTPALRAANNGNWQTARRWARALAGDYRVELSAEWDGSPAELMIALHARRSAGSIARFAPSGAPVALVLTGTDLYRDIDDDPNAQRSLALATRIVVLNPAGIRRLPPDCRDRAEVIIQSARPMPPIRPRQRTFDLLLIGHLRAEKDPMCAARALARIADSSVRLVQVGRTDDARTGPAFRAAAERDPRIERRGALAHSPTRRLIRRGRVLLLPSVIEGGANVLIEAVQSGIAVLASRIDGSTGLLGDSYPGLFDPGDDRALAALIERCRFEPGFIDQLRQAAAEHASAFDPALEVAAVRDLARGLLARARPR